MARQGLTRWKGQHDPRPGWDGFRRDDGAPGLGSFLRGLFGFHALHGLVSIGGGVKSVSYRNSVSYLCFLSVERLRYLENARTGTPGIKRSRFLADRSAK